MLHGTKSLFVCDWITLEKLQKYCGRGYEAQKVNCNYIIMEPYSGDISRMANRLPLLSNDIL